MNKVIEVIGTIITAIIGIVIVIVFIPFLIIIFPLYIIRSYTFEKRYSKFLNKNEGANLFVYNNRKDIHYYVEKNILPKINTQIDIVFLEGDTPNSKFKREFISHILNNLNDYQQYPHLIKLRKGQVIDQSINNLFYNVVSQTNTQEDLFNLMHQFFELQNSGFRIP